jgi:hypothetical protein
MILSENMMMSFGGNVGNYITAAGRIKREIDRRQRTTPFKRPGYKATASSR